MQGNVMWLDLVTYLHHHGHEDKLPWYRGKVKSKQNILADVVPRCENSTENKQRFLETKLSGKKGIIEQLAQEIYWST